MKNGFKIDIDEADDNIIYNATQEIITKIVSKQDEATIRAIERYCEENNIIPNIIEKEKLDLVLKLGIQELQLRELRGKNNDNTNI